MGRTDKRALIMKAAEKLFATRRFHEITLDDVIREAGVGKGTVYRHFRDKDDLFSQTATSGLDELCELVRSELSSEAPFREQVLSVCEAISGFFGRRRQLFRMMQSEDARMFCHKGRLREAWRSQRRKVIAAVAEVLARGVAEGDVRDDVPVEVMATYLLGALRTRARDLADASETARSYALLVDLFFHGAGRRKDQARGNRS